MVRTTSSNRLVGSKRRGVSGSTQSHRMLTDNNRLSAESDEEEGTHTEERQQEGVEVPEHEFFKNLPPFQGVGDIRVLLGLVADTLGFQPLALRDPDILHNVMQGQGFKSPQLDILPDVCIHDKIRGCWRCGTALPTTLYNFEVLLPSPECPRDDLFCDQYSIPIDLLWKMRVLKP